MDEITRYEDKIRNLELRLQETETNLHTSLVYGKSLLDENVQLKAAMAAEVSKNEARVDVLKQEKHNLSLQVESLQHQEKSFRDELESLERQHNADIRAIEDGAKQKVADITKDLGDLQTECEELRSRLKEAEDMRVSRDSQDAEFAEKVAEASRQEENLMIIQLQDEVTKLSAEKVALMHDISDNKQRVDKMEEQMHDLRQEYATLKTLYEEKEHQAASFAAALENSRTEVADLQEQLTSARTVEPDSSKRGNSLFGELDDRRQKLENHIRYLKGRYDKVNKQHQENQKMIYLLKLQKAAAVAVADKKVDPSYVERLEQRLSQAYTQYDELQFKLKRKSEAIFLCKNCSVDAIDKETGGEYGYLKVMLDQARNHAADLERDKQTVWLQYASERDEARRCRTRLCAAEADAERLQNENERLAAELEELQRQIQTQSEEQAADGSTIEMELAKSESGVKDGVGSGDVNELLPVDRRTSFEDKKPVVRVTQAKNECKPQ